MQVAQREIPSRYQETSLPPVRMVKCYRSPERLWHLCPPQYSDLAWSPKRPPTLTVFRDAQQHQEQ